MDVSKEERKKRKEKLANSQTRGCTTDEKRFILINLIVDKEKASQLQSLIFNKDGRVHVFILFIYFILLASPVTEQ